MPRLPPNLCPVVLLLPVNISFPLAATRSPGRITELVLLLNLDTDNIVISADDIVKCTITAVQHLKFSDCMVVLHAEDSNPKSNFL